MSGSKWHEMVEIAIEESWEVCVAHMERIIRTIGSVIAEGAASGEFEAPDVPLAAMCACTAMMRFFHPQMIAQCANKPGPSLEQMIDFALAGLARRAGSTVAKYPQGTTEPGRQGFALLRAGERARPQARSFQCHHRTASDRLDAVSGGEA